MRDLMRSERNRLVLTDSLTGGKIGLYYATPTAAQVIAYKQAALKRKGGKVVVDNFGPALKYGAEILTGFDEGAFGFDGRPISSTPGSENYREDWKALVCETAADIVALLGAVVFEGVRVEKDTSGIEFEGEEAAVAETETPLPKS